MRIPNMTGTGVWMSKICLIIVLRTDSRMVKIIDS